MDTSVGIESIGLKIPRHTISALQIAELNGQPAQKITRGLGCRQVALCWQPESVVTLAVEAASRALKRWGGALDDIGLIAVGTETSLDEARPLSAWIAEQLNLKGAVRSYEVKHACYAGTLALRQAMEWRLATGSSKKALVIAADVCVYAPGHGAEVTQGAAAAAFIVGTDRICTLDVRSYPYSEPIFDFWRPSGQPFPFVNGPKGLSGYFAAVEACFHSLFQDQPKLSPESFRFLCFHAPFPQLVFKACRRLLECFPPSRISCDDFLQTKLALAWNKEVGNAYTASLWLSVAQALSQARVGDLISCFSYGSGLGAELFWIRKGIGAHDWIDDIEQDLRDRVAVSSQAYQDWREEDFKKRVGAPLDVYAQSFRSVAGGS